MRWKCVHKAQTFFEHPELLVHRCGDPRSCKFDSIIIFSIHQFLCQWHWRFLYKIFFQNIRMLPRHSCYLYLILFINVVFMEYAKICLLCFKKIILWGTVNRHHASHWTKYLELILIFRGLPAGNHNLPFIFSAGPWEALQVRS